MIRRAAAAAAVVLLLVGAAAVAAWLGRAPLASWALSRATGHDVRVGDVRFAAGALTLLDLDLRAPAETAPLVRAAAVEAEAPWRYWTAGRVPRVVLAEPRLEVRRLADGRWNLLVLLEGGPPRPPGAPAAVERVVVRGGEAILDGAVRLRATGVEVDAAGDGSGLAVAARLAPGGDEAWPSPALDVALAARRSGAGWRLETAAVSAPGGGLSLDFSADLDETSARLSIARGAASETFLRALAPAWRGGSIEADSLALSLDVAGDWSATGGVRLVGPRLDIAGRPLALGRLDVAGRAAGTTDAVAGAGSLAGPGLRARWTVSRDSGAARVALEGVRLEGPALAALAPVIGLEAIEGGRLVGRAAVEANASGWRGRAAGEVEEVHLTARGRTIDLLYDTVAVEARGGPGGTEVEATANVEDAAGLHLAARLAADGTLRAVDLDLDLRRPATIAEVLRLPVAAPTGRVRLAAAAEARAGRLAGAGRLAVADLALAHETSGVRLRGIDLDLPFRLDLPADPTAWADARVLDRALTFDETAIAVDRVEVSHYHAADVRTRIAKTADTFAVRGATFDLYGGRGRWLRDASYRAADGFFEVALAAEGVDLERFSEDLARAHEAFRPPSIPAGARPLAGRVSVDATVLGDDRHGATTIEIEVTGEPPGVVVHNALARALYDRFGAVALEASLEPIQRYAERAVAAGVAQAAGRMGARLADTPTVDVRFDVRERIERRYREEAYSHYPEARARFFHDVDAPFKRIALVLREGDDPERDNINYDLNLVIPTDQDPFRVLGMLVAGDLPEIHYDWTQE